MKRKFSLLGLSTLLFATGALASSMVEIEPGLSEASKPIASAESQPLKEGEEVRFDLTVPLPNGQNWDERKTINGGYQTDGAMSSAVLFYRRARQDVLYGPVLRNV